MTSAAYHLRCTVTNPVPGQGGANTDSMFVGEVPGKKDQTWRPFLGAAGKILNQFLVHMGLFRDDMYHEKRKYLSTE